MKTKTFRDSASSGNKRSFGSKLPKSQRQLSILVVEDEPIIRELLTRAFNGHKVQAAANGQQGLEIFKKGNFDIIISDIEMPVLDGIDMIREIKKHNHNVKIVVISGGMDMERQKALQSLGPGALFIKPLSVAELADSVEKL